MESIESSEKITKSSDDDPRFPTRTPEEVRELDRVAIQVRGVPGLLLMEHAARSILEFTLDRTGSRALGGLRILVGKGNNGGDGLALARLAHSCGLPVECWLAFSIDRRIPGPGAPASDASTNCDLAERLNLVRFLHSEVGELAQRVRDCDPFPGVWVDALLGTGFQGELRPEYVALIKTLNRRQEAVLAIDIPSGLDGRTGRPSPIAARCRWTATLGVQKVGLLGPKTAAFTGETQVLGIGWPAGVQGQLAR